MGRKLSIIMLLIAVILSGMSGCRTQGEEPPPNIAERGTAAINQGAKRFLELKNGTLEATASISSENNAVESMGTGESKALTTFISRPQGYDYLQETSAKNEETGEISYSAIKQVDGGLFYSFSVGPAHAEGGRSYEWVDSGGEGSKPSYAPNGVLRMMTGPFKLLSDANYIESFEGGKDGPYEEYIVTASDAYKKYMKEVAHSQKENYTVREHRETYWIDQNGLLTKCQIREEFEWTIDGVSDTYLSNITVELTGYNYKKLKEIGDELD